MERARESPIGEEKVNGTGSGAVRLCMRYCGQPTADKLRAIWVRLTKSYTRVNDYLQQVLLHVNRQNLLHHDSNPICCGTEPRI